MTPRQEERSGWHNDFSVSYWQLVAYLRSPHSGRCGSGGGGGVPFHLPGETVDDKVRRDAVVAPTPLKVSQWTLSRKETLALACQVSWRSGEQQPSWPSCGTHTVRRPTGSGSSGSSGSVVSFLVPDWPGQKRRVHVRSALAPGTHACMHTACVCIRWRNRRGGQSQDEDDVRLESWCKNVNSVKCHRLYWSLVFGLQLGQEAQINWLQHRLLWNLPFVISQRAGFER